MMMKVDIGVIAAASQILELWQVQAKESQRFLGSHRN